MSDKLNASRTLKDLASLASSGVRSQSDRHLLRLVENLLREVEDYTSHHIERIQQLGRIGLALSAERDIDKLLEMIVEEARRLTQADAGTLYTKNRPGTHLDFRILQNDTLDLRHGGPSGQPITLPPVPLSLDGLPNHSNVSSHVAITGEIVNIPDVYQAQGFDFSGPRKYDQATGYRSTSMLVVPMTNHEGQIIGVLQLLNAKDELTGATIAFHEEFVESIAALASQAAVALTNAMLVQNLRELFESFIKSIATAIDCKSPYTGGHIKRVVTLTMMLAEKINQDHQGPFKDVCLTPDELEELRLAAWLHDVGKITTPEYVVDKRTKLETLFDRQEVVAARYDLAGKCLENEAQARRLALYEAGNTDLEAHAAITAKLKDELAALDQDKNLVIGCNSPGEFLNDENKQKLITAAKRRYCLDGRHYPLIKADELSNLLISRGTLNQAERQVIENHASMTMRILEEIPFPHRMSRVPVFAAQHHEKLDGTGYPNHLKGQEIPLQARILAIADIFEALTAKDRPYKKAMSLEQAIKVLGFMKKDGHIDPDLYDLFVSAKVYEDYQSKELADS